MCRAFSTGQSRVPARRKASSRILPARSTEYAQRDGGVEVLGFRQRPLPMFLEGFVHAMRIATAQEARGLYEAVRTSELFDRKLGMYRLNAPLGDEALELGRIAAFNYGWLENGSIFLHMHYKWVLEMVRAGLIAEFYADIGKLLVGLRDPAEYGRNPAENSSFLVSSGFAVDARQHGRGCVARLSGATVELLHLWVQLFLGGAPFVMEDGELLFRPVPALAGSLFTTQSQCVEPFGTRGSTSGRQRRLHLVGNDLARVPQSGSSRHVRARRRPTRRLCAPCA